MDVLETHNAVIYPDLILDKENGIFEIKGASLPENGVEFYQPVLDFLDEYVLEPQPTTIFVFNLTFFNVSSSKMFLYILFKLQELRKAGNNVMITWCYNNKSIHNDGKDFEQMCKIPFHFRKDIADVN
jgi:hypothetical protein